MELGASIFVTENKNLMRAAAEFNLTLIKFLDDDQEVGVWDGEQFLIKVGTAKSVCPSLTIVCSIDGRSRISAQLVEQIAGGVAVWL